MVISPYDWTQSIRQRAEYVEDRLREGSPVVGLSYGGGVLLFTVRGSQRKVFELYDRLMFSGLGHQADLEAVRLAAIDFAHEQGFRRSPEDVTVHRVVGGALSPALKRAFGDLLSHPLVARCIFAELVEQAQEDAFYLLDYDGEFTSRQQCAVVAGTAEAEEKALETLTARAAQPASLQEALEAALQAWGVAFAVTAQKPEERQEQEEAPPDAEGAIRQVLQESELEAAVLERDSPRQGKFRLLSAGELAFLRERYT